MLGKNTERQKINAMYLRNRKHEYLMNKIKEAGNYMNKLYFILYNLTGYKKKKKLPEGFNNKELAEKYLIFFL